MSWLKSDPREREAASYISDIVHSYCASTGPLLLDIQSTLSHAIVAREGESPSNEKRAKLFISALKPFLTSPRTSEVERAVTMLNFTVLPAFPNKHIITEISSSQWRGHFIRAYKSTMLQSLVQMLVDLRYAYPFPSCIEFARACEELDAAGAVIPDPSEVKLLKVRIARLQQQSGEIETQCATTASMLEEERKNAAMLARRCKEMESQVRQGKTSNAVQELSSWSHIALFRSDSAKLSPQDFLSAWTSGTESLEEEFHVEVHGLSSSMDALSQRCVKRGLELVTRRDIGGAEKKSVGFFSGEICGGVILLLKATLENTVETLEARPLRGKQRLSRELSTLFSGAKPDLLPDEVEEILTHDGKAEFNVLCNMKLMKRSLDVADKIGTAQDEAPCFVPLTNGVESATLVWLARNLVADVLSRRGVLDVARHVVELTEQKQRISRIEQTLLSMEEGEKLLSSPEVLVPTVGADVSASREQGPTIATRSSATRSVGNALSARLPGSETAIARHASRAVDDTGGTVSDLPATLVSKDSDSETTETNAKDYKHVAHYSSEDHPSSGGEDALSVGMVGGARTSTGQLLDEAEANSTLSNTSHGKHVIPDF